jgi:hypothetical protein
MRRILSMVGLVALVALVACACVLTGSWTALSPAAPPAPPPGVTSDPDFSDVSCPAVDWCLAVGAVVGDDYANWVPLAQVWDGSSWTVVDTSGLQAPDSPPEAIFTERLDHVACRAPNDCVVSLDQLFESDGSADIYGRVFTWDGTDWTQASFDFLEPEAPKDVDCAVGGVCIVLEQDLGGYAFWDGSTWSGDDSSFGDGPAACFGSNFCVRNGQWAGFMEHWDGVEWTVVDFPEENFVASAVDCTSATRCLAVGISDPDFSETGPLRSALWNGTAWTMEPVPVVGEGTVSALSCASSAECVALGESASGPVTVAWNGGDWYEIDGPPGQPATVYTSLSCVGLSCLAVGWSGPAATSSLAAADYTWTRD